MRDGIGGSGVNRQDLVVGFIIVGRAKAHYKTVIECSGGLVGSGGNGVLTS
jgi:hypothetical protein